MKDSVVIIGAGHAGVQAAASLRDEGFDGRIALIGDEAELPYHKPPLSKSFIKDAEARPQILRAEVFFSAADIELMTGESVEALDLSGREVRLASGAAIPFSHAILATGARPRPLAIEGGPLGGVLSLRSIGDARAIRERAAGVEDIVIMGGGFIGLEIAATLSSGDRRVTVIEAQDRLLARAVAPDVANHVARRIAASGVRLLTGTTIARLEGHDGEIAAVETSNGARIAAGMLIVGIGVLPNVELAFEAGLAVANGIRVDPQLRTAASNVLAIGDVAQYRHWLTGADVRLESVQNATDQAKLAARTVTGHAEHYAAVPWFWSDIGDMKLQMVGLTAGSDRQIVTGEPADNRFSVFHYLRDRLIGIETVNHPADHMLGRKMMAAGFSPDAQLVTAGTDAVKAAFTALEQAGN